MHTVDGEGKGGVVGEFDGPGPRGGGGEGSAKHLWNSTNTTACFFSKFFGQTRELVPRTEDR